MLAEFDFRILATVDAVLNGLAFVLICCGLVAIKLGRIEVHKKLMLSAVVVSTLFLVCYLTYHYKAGHVAFTQEGWISWVYYTLLISHALLAAVPLLPMVLRTVYLGLKDRREQHKKWAKVTTPLWLYVSLTGVIVYWMLYHL